ncbi:MAG TPA: putative N-acetylmannosamine-6-phosphate 2-epimerase [Thermomicrobiales bacterium]|nr:putative N-acetylmannosamine-6-phosphate 2-epimerase [Thermomicrobiales bacterium]
MALAADTLAELARLRGGLVVSCQAREGHPLHGPAFMAALAEAAVLGGAVGIRADGPGDIAAIRARVSVPLLGINKVEDADGGIFITPDVAAATAVLDAGARLVALDGTRRPRPGGADLRDVIAAIHARGAAALADVATLADGRYAVACGADLVGTTLSGYTPDSPRLDGPDLDLVRALVAGCPVPVFAEGRYWEPAQAAAALAAGAVFVVVGTAITNPVEITRRFVRALDGP